MLSVTYRIKAGAAAFIIVDDNFTGSKSQLKADVLPAFISWQKQYRGINSFTEASIDLTDDESLVAIMSMAAPTLCR